MAFSYIYYMGIGNTFHLDNEFGAILCLQVFFQAGNCNSFVKLILSWFAISWISYDIVVCMFDELPLLVTDWLIS